MRKRSQRVKYKATTLGTPMGKQDTNLTAFVCRIFSVFWGQLQGKPGLLRALGHCGDKVFEMCSQESHKQKHSPT